MFKPHSVKIEINRNKLKIFLNKKLQSLEFCTRNMLVMFVIWCRNSLCERLDKSFVCSANCNSVLRIVEFGDNFELLNRMSPALLSRRGYWPV